MIFISWSSDCNIGKYVNTGVGKLSPPGSRRNVGLNWSHK